MNTRFDYEYIRDTQQAGWQDEWRLLLEGRFCVENNELIEDVNAPIFRLGFTVEEVSDTIGFSGLTNREIEWRKSQPDRWELINGEWSEIEGWLDSRVSLRLAEAKQEKFESIQNEKCRLRDSGIVIDGVLFDTDAAADAKYTKMLLSCQIYPSYEVPDWKASDGVFVTMTKTLVLNVMMQSGSREAALTSKQKEKIAEVTSLTTLEDIYSYDVTSGWSI